MQIRTFVILGLFFGTLAHGQAVDLAKSGVSVEFLAVGKPAIKIRGKLKSTAVVTGALNVLPEAVTGDATLPLDSLDTGIELRDKPMKEKYLETHTYPTATLKGIKLSLTPNAGAVPFTGELSLHGKTKPITGVATVTKPQILFEFKISTHDFDINTPQFMGVTVADEVQISVKVEPGSVGAAG